MASLTYSQSCIVGASGGRLRSRSRLLLPEKSLLNTMGLWETIVSTAPFDVWSFSNLFRLDQEKGSQGRQRSARRGFIFTETFPFHPRSLELLSHLLSSYFALYRIYDSLRLTYTTLYIQLSSLVAKMSKPQWL